MRTLLHSQSPVWQMIVHGVPPPLPSLMPTFPSSSMHAHTHTCATDGTQGPVKLMTMYLPIVTY